MNIQKLCRKRIGFRTPRIVRQTLGHVVHLFFVWLVTACRFRQSLHFSSFLNKCACVQFSLQDLLLVGFAKATGFFDKQSTNGLACWLEILSWYRYLIMVPFIKGILGFQTNAPNQQFTIGWNRKSLKKHWKNKHLVIKSTFLQISFKVCGCCLVSLILFMWFSRIGSNQLSPTNYWSIRTASFSAQMLHPRNLR